ncbi:MAG: MaoC family dehydratase N-terminal domain-containing protein [Acidimicrobiales bacterium]
MTGGLLTAELRSCIGRTAGYTAPEPLGAGALRYYALAVGADPGRWVDEAPPTLIFDTCQLPGRSDPDGAGYLGHAWDLPLPVPCALIRGGNDYEWHRPARADDVISTHWTLSSIDERTGGDGSSFLVLTAEARYLGAEGDPIATNTETSILRPLQPAAGERAPAVVRSPAASALSAASALPPAHPEVADRVRPITQLHMVAYGGATWDWHRLHHDTAYARRAGMAGPVVDGQMLGALLAEHALAAADTVAPGLTARLTRLWYRNRAPVLAGDTVTCRVLAVGRENADRLRLDQLVLVGDRVVVGPAGAEVQLQA